MEAISNDLQDYYNWTTLFYGSDVVLVASKVQVAPLRNQKIPKLELIAAVLGVRKTAQNVGDDTARDVPEAERLYIWRKRLLSRNSKHSEYFRNYRDTATHKIVLYVNKNLTDKGLNKDIHRKYEKKKEVRNFEAPVVSGM